MMQRRNAWLAWVTGCACLPATAVAADPLPGPAGMLQMLPGLGLVLALILLLAWLAKRTGMGRAAIGGALRIVADKSVGARERVVIVEIAGQWLVLGVAPGQVRTLTQMARPEQTAVIAPDSATKPAFTVWLERALKKT